MYLRLRKIFPLLAVSLVSLSALAEDDLVEYRSDSAIDQPYSIRRAGHGWVFGLHSEKYVPSGFTSPIDGVSAEEVYGKDKGLQFLGFDFGFKFNFMLGALSAAVGYDIGGLAGSYHNQDRTLELDRTSLKLTYTMDNLMKEPYVAPYASFSIWQLGLDETDKSTDSFFSDKSGMGTGVSVGMLIQLNWLDPDSARTSYFSSGLENTYLDIFLSQMGKTDAPLDPDFSSDFSLGAGLRFEF